MDEDEKMTGSWAYVANGNSQAMMKAFEGNIREALANLDVVRDEAIAKETDAENRNEIECRRLETRMNIAAISQDWHFFGQCLQDIGASRRFSSDRLHYMFEVAGGILKSDFGKAPE